MTPLTFWSLFAAAIVAVLAGAYGIGWGLTDCPRWFLPCTCRQNLPGPAANRDSGSREPVYVGADGRAGEFHDEWEQLDPDQAADQLIAEWHGGVWHDAEGRTEQDVWDQWWAGVDGLERECMLVHDWLVREERLWAELKAETREMCAA